MERISRVLLFALLLLSACSTATSGCHGIVVTRVLRFSGGPAPSRIATAEVYEGGCVRYEAGRTKRCLCESPLRLRDAFGSERVEEVIAGIRIVPTTLVDSEGVAVRHRDLVGERANRDLPKRAREWLSALDAALQPLIGAGYTPFLPLPEQPSTPK